MTRLHVLSVGVSCYEDSDIPDLRFAANDATAFDAAIRQSIADEDLDAHLLVDDQASRRSILGHFGNQIPRRASGEDIVLFYFAGHGSPEIAAGRPTASRFLACTDSKRDSLFATAIDITADLTRAMERMEARLVVLIMDACFSGYSGGRGIAGAAWESFRWEHRASPRLADLDLGSGTVFMAAARDTDVAWEDDRLRHGVFSYHLLEVLREAPERTGPPWIGVGTIYDSVRERVHKFTHGRQQPVLWGSVIGASLPRLTGVLE